MEEYKNISKEEKYKKAYEALKRAFVNVKGVQNIKASCVAFNNTVIIKKIQSGHEAVTEGGLIVPESSSVNSIKPNIGIIVAAGPECSNLVFPGLKIAYNQFANLEVFIRGEFYHVIHEADIHCALTDDAFVLADGKTDKEIRTEKGLKDNVRAHQVFEQRHEEIKDKFDFKLGKNK